MSTWSTDYLIHWLFNWLVDRLADRQADRYTDNRLTERFPSDCPYYHLRSTPLCGSVVASFLLPRIRFCLFLYIIHTTRSTLGTDPASKESENSIYLELCFCLVQVESLNGIGHVEFLISIFLSFLNKYNKCKMLLVVLKQYNYKP